MQRSFFYFVSFVEMMGGSASLEAKLGMWNPFEITLFLYKHKNWFDAHASTRPSSAVIVTFFSKTHFFVNLLAF